MQSGVAVQIQIAMARKTMTFVSLNSRLESHKEEEKKNDEPAARPAAHDCTERMLCPDKYHGLTAFSGTRLRRVHPRILGGIRAAPNPQMRTPKPGIGGAGTVASPTEEGGERGGQGRRALW